jgi:hypothetical protein
MAWKTTRRMSKTARPAEAIAAISTTHKSSPDAWPTAMPQASRLTRGEALQVHLALPDIHRAGAEVDSLAETTPRYVLLQTGYSSAKGESQ